MIIFQSPRSSAEEIAQKKASRKLVSLRPALHTKIKRAFHCQHAFCLEAKATEGSTVHAADANTQAGTYSEIGITQTAVTGAVNPNASPQSTVGCIATVVDIAIRAIATAVVTIVSMAIMSMTMMSVAIMSVVMTAVVMIVVPMVSVPVMISVLRVPVVVMSAAMAIAGPGLWQIPTT